MGGIGIWQLVIVVAYLLIIVVPFWRITTRIGFPGWLSLLMIVPFVNLVYLYFLAFASWPSQKGINE